MENEALKELLELTPRLAVLNKDVKKVPAQRLEEIEQMANKGLILMQALESLCKSTDQAYARISIKQ